MLGEGVNLMSGDDEMVENTDIHQGQRLHQRARQQQIRLARLRRSRWMVVRQHDAGGVARQRLLDHFTRINAGVD